MTDQEEREGIIIKIKEATDSLTILYLLSDAFKMMVDERISDKAYSYIKGYADCKIETLKTNI